MKYRTDIDGLRAVAVLPVVMYHAGLPGIPGGFIGVDVFFVISGFLITSIVAGEIAEGRFSLISFYERRARRILPALTVVIFASFLISWFVLLPGEMQTLGQSALATAFFASNIYFMTTRDYFGPAAEFAPLLHTWSLAVEEQFYLFFPPLLMFLARRGGQRTLWIVAGLSLLSLSAAVVMLPAQPGWVFYLIVFRAWELGAGALLALAPISPPKTRLTREVVALSGLVAILLPVFLFDSATPFPAAAAVPPVLGATLLIWIGTQGGGSLVNALLGLRALVWVGLISYSLYLWHWPILALLRIVLDTAALPTPIALAAVAGSIGMAWLSFRYVERPFRVDPSRGFGRRSVFAASVISLAIVAGAGLILDISQGLPIRLPAKATAMVAFADDTNPRRAECMGQTPADGLCALGLPGDPGDAIDFLFWGDSHADAILPGMDAAAEQAGQRGVFAGKAGCPPILDVQRFSSGNTCQPDFSASIWAWLDSRPDVPLVVLGARWTLYVEGTRPPGEAGTDMRLAWTGDPALNPITPGNAALMEYSLARTVSAILASGRHVVLLGPIPEVGRDVPNTLARAALFGRTPEPFLTTDAYKARAARTEALLARIAEADDHVTYVPLADLFCDTQFCRVTSEDGFSFYVDSNHISQTAARTLLPPRLEEMWQRR